MRSILVATALGALALLPSGGCASSKSVQPGIHFAQSHIIFNPYWTGIPLSSQMRSEWPSTPAFRPQIESIEYREHYYDIPAPSHSAQDYTYRRFTSVRTGRIRR